jgi:peroxiredoxin/outer membrane lipoprotein-sorting protein
MVGAMRAADSLSYESHYTWRVNGDVKGDFIYRVWLKKPNSFRVEVEAVDTGKMHGVLIGDGTTAWLYWPHGRPQWSLVPEDPVASQKTRFSSYWKTPTPTGEYSIGHAMVYSAENMFLPIVDPSTFHGLTDSLQAYTDGMKSLGTETVDSDVCDKIEVSFMNHQRSWTLWLSQRTHLPRKLEAVVRAKDEMVANEEWSSVVVNDDIDGSKFIWKTPEGWTEWVRPEPEGSLLKPGTKAPDFDLVSADGNRIKLSDYRGQIVCLHNWRVGCPPCREGAGPLQDLYMKYRDQGLVVLGINCDDDKNIALEFIHDTGTTFPNILDTSAAAEKVCVKDYRCFGVPVNYIIDSTGNVVDAWYGNSTERALAAIKKTGGPLAKTLP